MTHHHFIEQRCAERMTIRRPVKLHEASEESRIIHGQLLDISDCGLGILTSEALPLYTQPRVDFTLPTYENETPLCILTQVKRIDKVREQYLVGLEILKPTAHDLLVIQAFFQYHKRFMA